MASYLIRVKGSLDDSLIRKQLRAIERRTKLNIGGTVGGSGKTKGGSTVVGGTTSDKANKGMQTYMRNVSKAEKANKRFGATTLDITKKVIQFGVTTAVIRGVTSGIGDAVQNVFELDKALTEFKKVSDLSGKGLEKYTDQAFKVGRTVAKTGTEMVEAATEVKKSGFNEEDSMKLARVASWIQDEYVAIHIKNRVNCWKPKCA